MATTIIAKKSGLIVDPLYSTSEWFNTLVEALAEWQKKWEEKRFSKHLLHHSTNLRMQIIKAIEVAGDKSSKSKENAIKVVKQLLEDKNSTNKIDSCVRWLILCGLVSSETSDDPEVPGDADTEVVEILVNAEPFLAFENPHEMPGSINGVTSESPNPWKIKCADEKAHWGAKQRSTPFYKAAENGNAKALRHMITSLEKYCDIQRQNKERGDPAYQRPMFFGLSTMDDPVPGILHMPDSSSRKTALQCAAERGSKGNFETLDVLLPYPGVTAPSDIIFTDALESGAAGVIARFLKHPNLVQAFVTSGNIIHAMRKVSRRRDREHADTPASDPGIEIVHLLLQHATTDEVFNGDVVKTIISMNLTKVWNDHTPKQLDLEKYHPLHLAVMHQSLDFVEMFVKEYNESVNKRATIPETDGKAYYPLWFNNRKWDESKTTWTKRSGSTDIRTELVIATIKRVDKMHDLSDILQRSDEKARELCFDISLFNSKSYRLYDFVRSLITHHENETLLEYEPSLKYARFPPMDLHPKDKEIFGEPVRRDHREVFDVLTWLRDVKKVRSVIELKVPDRLVNPHNEKRIAKVVKEFGVEMLDWRFLDLSLSVFADVRTQIKGLHLYSSGKRAVISHWMSEEGLGSLTELESLHVHVVQETMTKASCEKTCKFIRRELGVLRRKRGWKWDYAVGSQPWNPKHDVLEDLGELAQRAFPTLSPFILSYRTHVTKCSPPNEFTPTKIAIIDNGIMSMSPATSDEPRSHRRSWTTRHAKLEGTPPAVASQSKSLKEVGVKPAPSVDIGRRTASDGESSTDGTGEDEGDENHNHNKDKDKDSSQADLSNQKRRDKAKGQRTLWSRIKLGRSFVDNDFQLSPWLFASDPHGTQMANLICAIDPACELYVAKVTDGRDGVTPERVARAIDWAIQQKVDIISMSIAMYETIPMLNDVVSKAHAAGIIMLCSTHDEGANVAQAYPASLPSTWAVTACNEYGTPYRAMKNDSFKYMLQGLNVAAGVIHFLDSTDRISGSSVATAVAAGLSSLILSCLRLANPGRQFQGAYRAGMVETKMDEMLAHSTSKYVILEKFGGIDKYLKTSEPINADVIIDEAFKVSASAR